MKKDRLTALVLIALTAILVGCTAPAPTATPAPPPPPTAAPTKPLPLTATPVPATAAPLSTPTTTPTIPSAVQEYIRELVDNDYSRGVVVALIDASGTTYYSYGRMSENGAPVDEHTIFEIGSVTKVFTAILLADLVERGVVTLDTPIEKYLPPEVRAPERNGKKITLEHLATHRSGLPRMPTNWNPQDLNNPDADYTTQMLYEFLSSYTLPRDPGAQYEYSNLGAGLLGHILARLADKPYEQLVIDRISQPLGMNDTRITLSEEQRSRLARGHLADGQPVGNWDFDALAGAGALRSSAVDLARFVAANLGLYKTDLYPVLQRTHQVRADTGEAGVEMALGWVVITPRGNAIICHGGGTGGYRSWVGFDPSRKVGVVVLSNSNYESIVGAIGVHLLAPQVELPRVKKAIAVAPSVLAAYTGTYELEPGVLADVTVENGTLLVQITGVPRYRAYPESETTFFIKVIDVQITFQKDAKGNVVGLVLHEEGKDYAAKKIK